MGLVSELSDLLKNCMKTYASEQNLIIIFTSSGGSGGDGLITHHSASSKKISVTKI